VEPTSELLLDLLERALAGTLKKETVA
jgi:hypothetical protein